MMTVKEDTEKGGHVRQKGAEKLKGLKHREIKA